MTIGVELCPDTLVLTRGREFDWQFTNMDYSAGPPGVPTAFPAGSLYFELNTGGQQDCIQQIETSAATGGTYTLSFNGHTTANLAYNILTADLQTALEGLSSVGSGNVSLTPAQLYPVWELDLTLNAGNDEIQQLIFSGVTGGGFKLGYDGNYTSVLAWNATPSTVQTALQGLSGIGSGNVNVSALANGYQFKFVGSLANTNVDQIQVSASGIDMAYSGYVYGLTGTSPQATMSTVVQGTSAITDTLVATINNTINSLFATFDSVLGVDIDFTINSALDMTLKVTGTNAFAEADILSFAVNLTSSVVTGFFDSVAALVGIFNTVSVNFYWNRFYQVEFVGALALSSQPAITSNVTSLTGVNSEQAVTISTVQPGVSQFTQWPFTISGSTATISIAHTAADAIPNRTQWQLVFLPSGDTSGGQAIALGRVRVQPCN